MSSPSFSRPPSAESARHTPKGTDKAELGGPDVVHDAVFGELSGGGPNYRNVSRVTDRHR